MILTKYTEFSIKFANHRSVYYVFSLGKKYIRDRIDGDGGILLSEFLYQVLQAYDWQHLHDRYNCNFQIGGIDQLGNIDAGHDLIKRYE